MRTRFALGFGLVLAACLVFAPPPSTTVTTSPAELLVQRDTSCTIAPIDSVDVVMVRAASVAPIHFERTGSPALPTTLLLSLAGVVGMTAIVREEEKSTKREIDGAVHVKDKVYTKGQEDALARVLGQKDIDRLVEKGTLKGDWSRGPKPVDSIVSTAADAKGASATETSGAASSAKSEATVKTPATAAAPAKPAAKRARKSAAKPKAAKKSRGA